MSREDTLDITALIILLLLLPGFRIYVRVGQAKDENDRTRDALNEWIRTHPDCSLSSPQAQALIRGRRTAWKAYVKSCPVLDDRGVLERYLCACLEDPADQPAPYPMP